jgi:iron-sulfur cluster repair protein YtfE (RIC family)
MTIPLERPRLLPALDPDRAPNRPSAQEIHARERQRPGFAFAVRDHGSDFIAAYPELEQVWAGLGLEPGDTLAEGCADPQAALLELARAARPPHRWSTGIVSAPVPALVAELAERQHRTLRWELARLELLIDRQATAHHRLGVRTLRCGWGLFRDRLLEHLHEEEVECFPLCLRLAGDGSEPLPPAGECALRLALMGETHRQTLDELDELLVLARRADLSVMDPDLDVVVHGFEALRTALIIHTGLEGSSLMPRCARLALEKAGVARG